MLYSYTAKNVKGETYTGEFDAESKLKLFDKIRTEGGHLLSVKEESVKKEGSFLGNLFGSVNTHDKIFFAKNLSSMLTAGLSMTRALEVMEKQSKKVSLKKLLHSIMEEVSKGQALSEALRKRVEIFPTIFVSMVRSGEESGNLSGSLDVVGTQMEKSYELIKKVRGAMIYPSLILSLMIVVSILLLIYMVPTLTSTFAGLGIKLPLSTRVIIGMSNFMVEHTTWFLSGVCAFLVIIISAFKSRAGRRLSDKVFTRLPAIGVIVKEVNSARTARTLSSLLSAGVPIVTALETTNEVLTNHLYKNVLNEARMAVERGESLSKVFDRYEDVYPPFVGEMVAVGEETGKISDMLLNVAVYYESDVEEKTKDLSTIVEPVLMIIIGIGVGIFAISMLAPTYSLVNNL